MKVQNNSWCRSKRFLRVAASSNPALNLAPFSRWTLREKAAQRRLALRLGVMRQIAALLMFVTITSTVLAEPLFVRFDGFGPVTVGMTKAAVDRALAQKLEQPPESHDNECEYFVPTKGLAGVLFMFSHGRLVRIDVKKGKTQTELGIRIGDSISKIRKAYTTGVAITAHQYIPAPQGKYVTVKSPDGKHAIRFETDNGRVVAFYSGRFPEVEYVERCL